jgi:hypothetical protein
LPHPQDLCVTQSSGLLFRHRADASFGNPSGSVVAHDIYLVAV